MSANAITIALSRLAFRIASMSNRDIAIDLIKKLPEDASLQEIAREIEFVAGLRKAREEAVRGEGVKAEKAKQLVDSWASQ